MTKKSKSKVRLKAQGLGAWSSHARKKIHGSRGKKYSDYQVMLRDVYARAFEGDNKSIRFMLQIMNGNLKAHNYHYPQVRDVVIWRGGSPSRRPEKDASNADLALIILGIATVSDRRLKELRGNFERSYAEKLRDLRPDWLEPWVAELAGRDPLDFPYEIAGSFNDPRLSEWSSSKAQLTVELMRERGPGATRFKPGQSGNPKGRPRAKAMYPFEDFFLEPYTVKFGGELIKTTRLDALLRHLVSKAAKGDDKLRDLLLPILAKIEQAEWEEANIDRQPRVIRGWTAKGKKL